MVKENFFLKLFENFFATAEKVQKLEFHREEQTVPFKKFN